MVGLTDIAPQTQKVQVNGTTVDVFGISAEGIASLLPRFPELQKLMQGQQLSPEDVIKVAPMAIAAIIAAGCGMPGNETAEKVAARLSIESQLDFLEAIGGMTFSKGIGPFVKRLETLSEAVSGNYGKVPVMKSPPQSKTSSPKDLKPATSGL